MAADRSKQEARRQWIRDQIANPPRVPPKTLPKCSFCLEPIRMAHSALRRARATYGFALPAIELAAELLAEFKAAANSVI